MPPVRDLRGVSFYTDAAKSVADPALKQAADEAVRPLWDFVKAIDALVDAGSAPAQDCALRALAAWARGGALLGQANQQGGYEREMALSGLSLAFARLGDARARAPALDASVGDWLRRVALAVEPAYTRPWRTDNRNNHAYWAGLAVAATGDTTSDPALVAWGLHQAELGIAQIRPDGTLPLEMARGARALHYDLFALTPLVMTAEIGLRHGVDLYTARHSALRRLAERALAGLDDPAWFAARAGAPQDAPGHLPPEDVAWMEPYYARFHDPGLEPWLDRLRPIRSARLGGNVTERFAPSAS